MTRHMEHVETFAEQDIGIPVAQSDGIRLPVSDEAQLDRNSIHSQGHDFSRTGKQGAAWESHGSVRAGTLTEQTNGVVPVVRAECADSQENLTRDEEFGGGLRQEPCPQTLALQALATPVLSGLKPIRDEIADRTPDFLPTPGFKPDVRIRVVSGDGMGKSGRSDPNKGCSVHPEGELLRHPIGRGSHDLEVVVDGGTGHAGAFVEIPGAMHLFRRELISVTPTGIGPKWVDSGHQADTNDSGAFEWRPTMRYPDSPIQLSPASRLCTAFLATTTMVTASGDVLTVDDDGPADFATIQEAVDAAVSGDTIEVAPGYYYNLDSMSPEPVVRIVGKQLKIISTSWNAGDTIISGQGMRRCVEWKDVPGIDSQFLRFTIHGGYSPDSGAGLHLDESRVVISGCDIHGNHTQGDGGGIFSRSTGQHAPYLSACEIHSNSAGRHGGGLYADGGFDMQHSKIEECRANVGRGGGMYLTGNAGHGGPSVLVGNTFENCTAFIGGGLAVSSAGLQCFDGTFQSCNAATSDFDFEGMIWAAPIDTVQCWGGGVSILQSEVLMAGTDVLDCKAILNGGGIDVESSTLSFSEASCTGNLVFGQGGAINGIGNTSRISLSEVELRENTSIQDKGGAIAGAEFMGTHIGRLELESCVFENNSAGTGSVLDVPNVVQAIDCQFLRQEDPVVVWGLTVAAEHVRITGVGTGSRFEGCLFRDAEAEIGPSSILAEGIGGFELVDCEFLNNLTTSDWGGDYGAVRIDADPESEAGLGITGCRFENNGGCCDNEGFFTGVGGAISASGRFMDIAFCEFTSNRAEAGGSIAGPARIRNSRIHGLASFSGGGAVNLAEGSTVTDTYLRGTCDTNYGVIDAGGPVHLEGCTIASGQFMNLWGVHLPHELAGYNLPEGSTVRNTHFCYYNPHPMHNEWTDLGGNVLREDGCVDGDIDGDGSVGGGDLAMILAAWGTDCLGCHADLNGDGVVDGADMALVLASWG